MMAVTKPLAEKRLLIVEDEWLVAIELAEVMKALGAEITAIAGKLADAMAAADRPIDGALVDVQLGREQSLPLIEKLSRAGIPFILMTGYDPSVLPATLGAYPRLAKPSSAGLLQKMAQDVFGRE